MSLNARSGCPALLQHNPNAFCCSELAPRSRALHIRKPSCRGLAETPGGDELSGSHAAKPVLPWWQLQQPQQVAGFREAVSIDLPRAVARHGS